VGGHDIRACNPSLPEQVMQVACDRIAVLGVGRIVASAVAGAVV
jgi:hypothetical protein